jgi:hypothetical protein
MRTDKSKLAQAFAAKFADIYLKLGPESNRALEREWLEYVESLGCLMVMTPNGMLPFHHPNFVHIVDPGTNPDRDYHIQIPKALAERILAIGLP